jgi:2-polyprenyl-3-methyl-5-hydroxy-6-metoxy-1,4-benzoquinol methylase
VSRPCPSCGAAEARPFAEKNAHRVVRCGRCATLYTSDAVQKVYDDLYAEENPHYPPFLRKRLDDIVAGFAPSRRTGRLLEVGFGDGELLEAARRAGWTVSGIELARPAVERARRRGIDAAHGALAEAPYQAESFDVVVAAEIFEHVNDVRPLLDGIVRVLRPGGLLWATTPHGRGISARLLGASWSVVNPPGHVQLFSIDGLRQLLRAAGFGDIAISAEGVNPHEILQRLRGGKMRAGERIDAAYALNAFLEEHRGRRAVKRAINRLLSALRLGDSLKISARRP